MTTATLPTPEVPDEDHSTGSYWRAPKLRPTPELPPRYRPCTPEEQAQHWADLGEAISGYVVGRPRQSGTDTDRR